MFYRKTKHVRLFVFGTLTMTLLGGCSTIKQVQDGAPPNPVITTNIPNAVPKDEPLSRYGNPPSYIVNGQRYNVLKSARGYCKTGIASWYGTKFQGKLTSTREIYNMFAMTAASTELPLPTYAKVTNLNNGRQIIVKVNDRGPFDKDRIIDLSYVGAEKLGFLNKGTALVRVTAIDPKQWHANQAPSKVVPITHKPQLFLQVAAFSRHSSAVALKKKLAVFVHDPIKIAKAEKQDLYRVQIGPIKNVNNSDTLQKKLVLHNLGHGIPLVLP